MPGIYRQKGPRAHTFVASVSLAIGSSVFFEYYATNIVFNSLDGFFGLDGQHAWGLLFLSLGALLFQRKSIMLRALIEVVLCFMYTTFGCYSLYISLFGPMAAQAGSVFGILSLALACTCILATSNLQRDFYKTDRVWLRENPDAEVVDKNRAKSGDSRRE